MSMTAGTVALSSMLANYCTLSYSINMNISTAMVWGSRHANRAGKDTRQSEKRTLLLTKNLAMKNFLSKIYQEIVHTLITAPPQS